MSSAKDYRKIRSDLGKTFPVSGVELPGSSGFAVKIGDALRTEFGATTAGVKFVVALTGANVRAVRNWFSAKNGPSGENLVDLMRHSDAVLQAVLLMAGRKELTKVKMVADAEKHLQHVLAQMIEIEKG